MNIDLTRYDAATGRILGTINCAESDAELNKELYPEDAWIEGGAEHGFHWVDITREPLGIWPRPSMAGFDKLEIAADDAEAAVLTLPEPFTAEVDGVEYQIDVANDAGEYELAITSAMPASYRVTITHFPYLDYSAEIVAA